MFAPTDGILLVEDNEDDILLVRRAMAKASVAVPLEAVRDGDAAVEYLTNSGRYSGKSHPTPSLVLLDLKLPRRSGFEVLSWLRGHAVLRKLPVVVLTSSRETADVDRAYELGANTYLAKPVEFDGLLEVVKVLHLYWLLLAEKPSPPTI